MTEKANRNRQNFERRIRIWCLFRLFYIVNQNVSPQFLNIPIKKILQKSIDFLG